MSRRHYPRIGSGFPPEEGHRVARDLLYRGDNLEGLEIDVRGISPETLIGPFFFGFLQTVHEFAPDRLAVARKIRWLLDYSFQEQSVADWMRSFRPN